MLSSLFVISEKWLKSNSKKSYFGMWLFAMAAVSGTGFLLNSFYSPTTFAAVVNPPGASVNVKVQVPASMRTAPFNTDRYLNVPTNFSIAVYARVPNARFMATAPNGDLLVSQPDLGKVSIVRPNSSGDPLISNFVTGLRRPHDIVFHAISGTTYVYITETHQVNRFVYNNGDLTAHDRQLIVTGLPDSETPGELQGAHNHSLKNIAIDSQHNLYVSSASASNASPSDTTANPKRAAIYVYNSQTQQTATQGRLFAQGIRNAEGLAFLPGSDELWVVINNRDNIKYPFRNDFDGDGTDDFGKTLPAYVDNHPPEEFTRVRDGGNYGWPFANPNPDTANGLNNMPFDFDYDNNRDWNLYPETTFDRITKGIQAHSAPLGLSFLQNTNAPAAYRNGAIVAYHGSWNRTQRTGYKVAYFAWDTATNAPGDEINLVTGWINSDQSVWGRPVDAITDQAGNILISDDYNGTVYKLTYATSSVVPNGTYRLTAECSGKALDVSGAGLQDGANVIQWSAHSGANQKWQVQSLDNGYYKLTAVHSGKLLDVQYAGQTDGTNVWQYTSNSGNAQQWQIVSVGNNYYKLLPRSSPGKALDVSGASTANGANVQIWTDNGTAAQRWRFETVQ